MKNINKILNDLYAIDESLRQYEPGLKKIISELIVSRPDTRFDEHFASKLRSEVLARVQELKANNSLKTKFNFNFNFKNMLESFTIKKLSYAGAGIAVVVLALVFLQNTKNVLIPSQNDDQLAFSPQITAIGENAFGSLSQPSAQNEANMARPPASPDASLGGQSGGGSDMAAGKAFGLGGGGGGMPAAESAAITADGKMIAPDFVTYTYKYSGDEIVLGDATVAVLKRVKGQASADGLRPYLDQLNFGINLKSFSNLQLQGLSVSEDKEFGYTIYLSPMEGMISVSEQWDKWQSIYPKCQDDVCWQNSRLKIGDVPADDVLIRMASEFLSARGVALTNYGAPSVENQWRVQYAQAEKTDFAWVPDAVTVRYPLVINGQTVYEEGGAFFGLTVNINIRANRVSGFWNYTTNVYQSSEYTATTDVVGVIKAAEQGGRSYGWQSEGGRKETVELGTPTRGYVKIWKYHEDTGINDELLAPALVFPVVNKPENFYQEAVVIPLVREILDDYLREPDYPRPMPLGKPLPVEPLTDGAAPAIDSVPPADIPVSSDETQTDQ